MVLIENGVATFSFYRPGASQVHLVGDFNHWQAGQSAMIDVGEGHWKAILSLPAGAHRFRYLVDGEWFTDFAAFGVEPGEHGWDSVLFVPPWQAGLEAA